MLERPRCGVFGRPHAPATRIVELAKQWPADLIVMGSHGRGGVQRMLRGSVAEQVMRHAPCPILIAPATA
jgi:nucleotide-binding universal stress UspA family protein